MGEAVFEGLSAEELDRQYNNRAAVPDHGQYLERWAADSAAARSGYAASLDVAYGAGERETMDIFPARGPGAPVVVFIHGGYWQALDKSSFSFAAPPLLARGCTVVVAGYPLCPAVALPDIVRGLRWAMVFLHRNIARYNGDPERMCVAGHSAGGHLAAMLMATPWSRLDASLDDGMVDHAVGISGLYELEPLRHTYLNQALRLDRSSAAEMSPARRPPPASGRLDLFVGAEESDEYHRQVQRLDQAWSNGGVAVHRYVAAGRHHFSILDEMTEPEGAILRRLTGDE